LKSPKKHGTARRLDRALLLVMRNPSDLSDPKGPQWFEETVRDFTALGATGPLAFAVAVVLGYLTLAYRRKTALIVLLAEVGGIGFNQLLKGYFARPRPQLVPQKVYVLGESFPSGHSMMAAITYLTLAALLVSEDSPMRHRLYLLGCALLLIMLIGLSRVYLGVHWPTDVLAGWAAGAGWATAWWLIARRVGAR